MIPFKVIEQILGARADKPSLELFKGAGSAFILNACGLALAFLLQILLARLMSPTDYGAYNYVLACLAILLLPAVFGLDYVLLRFIPNYLSCKQPALLKGLLRVSFLVVFVLSILAASGVFIFQQAELINQKVLSDAFKFAPALLPIWAFLMISQAGLRAQKKIISARLPDTLIKPVLFAAIVGLLFFNDQRSFPAVQIVLIHAGALSITLLCSLFLLKHSLLETLRYVKAQYESRLWLKTGAGLMLVSGMHVILNEVDKIMIGSMLKVEDVALYSVAARLSLLILFGMQAINTIAAPMISEYYSNKSHTELQQMVSRVAKWIATISLPAILLLVVFGYEVLGLFGALYREAYLPLLVLVAGQAVNVSVGSVGFLLTMTGHEKQQLRILLKTLVVNLVLNIPAIYFFGILGAAAATSFSIALRNILSWHAVKQNLKVDASVFAVIR